MKKHFALALVLCLAAAGSAFAADDGNAKWRLSTTNVLNPGTTYDIIATTNGSGNVKGVHCDGPNALALSIYVNGGSAETFVWDPGMNDDGFVPFNIQFTSSIRVTASRSNGLYQQDHVCEVSWGLN